MKINAISLNIKAQNNKALYRGRLTNPQLINSTKIITLTGNDSAQKENVLKPLPEYNSVYICTYRKAVGGLCSLPDYLPKDYVRKTKYGDYEYAPYYKLDKLWAKSKGDGTSGIQTVLLKSIVDNDTQGRVLLDACCFDNKTAPGAFYYKLGFRFNNPLTNKECEQWIKSGGKYEDAPFATGMMHLPKENIEHCLKYGNEKYYYEVILPIYQDKINRAL